MKQNILYEDAQMLVLHKPAGIAVQSAGVGQQDCVSMLKNYLYEKNPEAGEPYLGVVHRLDQPVEGLVVFAKTPAAAAELSRQVTGGQMQKYYLALCRNFSKCGQCGQKKQDMHNVDNVDILVDNSMVLVDFLLKDGKNNVSFVVPEKTRGAKRAELHARILQETENEKLVEIKLITGRHHQIRVQMAHHGMPLEGDVKYCPQLVEEQNVDKFARKREKVALCAYRLEVIHPASKKKMHFEIVPRHEKLGHVYRNWKEKAGKL